MGEIGVESVHRARVLIYQRHIRVGHQVVTSPSFWCARNRSDLSTSARAVRWEAAHRERSSAETLSARRRNRRRLSRAEEMEAMMNKLTKDSKRVEFFFECNQRQRRMAY